MQKESCESTPTHQRDCDKYHAGDFLNSCLGGFGNRNAPPDAEVPDSVAKVVRGPQNSDHIDQENDGIVKFI